MKKPRIKLFFDGCVFNYFYNRSINPFEILSSQKFQFLITAQIHEEIMSSGTPLHIQQWVEDLLSKGIIAIHAYFGFATYQNLSPRGVAGLISYNDYYTVEGSWITYDKMTRDGAGESYLNKPSSVTKKNNDRLLATHAVHNVVLTCDTKDALGQAYKDEMNVVFLGKVAFRPQNACGFDNFDGTLEEYILLYTKPSKQT